MAAPPSRQFAAPESSRDPFPVAVVMLLAGALLLFAGVAISPALDRWPRLATGFVTHRGDLAVMGFGMAGIAFALLFVHQAAH